MPFSRQVAKYEVRGSVYPAGAACRVLPGLSGRLPADPNEKIIACRAPRSAWPSTERNHHDYVRHLDRTPL